MAEQSEPTTGPLVLIDHPTRADTGPEAMRVLMSLGAQQSAAPPTPAPERASRHERRRRRRVLLMAGLCLAVIMATQVTLSLRLLWSNTAFLDEATYLFAGQQELAHIAHGTPVEAYSAYFSGAPVIYPVLAGVLNWFGGLTAARLLSLACMLGATLTLWDSTRRLLGLRAATFAASLFVALGPTQFLSALATYDAMALFLVTAAAWLAVMAKDHDDSTFLLVGAAVCLAAANATKYATGLFDPTVCLIAALSVAERRGWRAAFGRAGSVATFAVGLLSLLLFLGGADYVTGLLSTTIARPNGDNPALLVLTDSARWIGFLCLLAFAGAAIAMRAPNRPRAWLMALMAVTGVLAPANQARIHTTTSLSKHVDFGAWFAAMAAAYLLARLTRSPSRSLSTLMTGLVPAVVVLPMLSVGSSQATAFFQQWPNATNLVSTLRTAIARRPGPYLVEDYDVPAYYLESTRSWRAWDNTWYFAYRDPVTRKNLVGQPAYAAAIKDRYFSLIVLDFGDTSVTDHQIVDDIHQFGGYRVIAAAQYSDRFGPGQFTIWGRR